MTDYDDSPTTAKVRAAVNQYLKRVRGSGSQNIVALCPFHDDSTPSFSMNITNGLFLCFSCGVTGNFRKFLAQIGMTPQEIKYHYGQTLEQLKQNAPPPPDPTKPSVIMESNLHVPEELLGIFHKCPIMLLEEGYEESTLRDFDIGVDDKHGRITFPIRDLAGNLVGISGRAMDEFREPRYKVYDEEYKDWELPMYNTDKAHCLWNAHRVQRNFKLGVEPLVIVEGFKACMWIKQAGIPNVVALMTKSMSWHQEWMLRHMTNHHILMLDNDDAGIAGTIKVSRALGKASPFLRVVEYAHLGDQPTDVPLEDVVELIDGATPYHELLD